MPIVRNSKQRTAIYTELCSRCDHPTAEELYLSLKEINPTLSLATVYRNLKQLCEEGKAICIRGDVSDRFDATVSPHYHLSCKECHGLYDLDIPEMPEIGNAAQSRFGGRIDTYTLIYKGVCEDCLKALN